MIDCSVGDERILIHLYQTWMNSSGSPGALPQNRWIHTSSTAGVNRSLLPRLRRIVLNALTQGRDGSLMDLVTKLVTLAFMIDCRSWQPSPPFAIGPQAHMSETVFLS